jgi:hypothetical protein
MECVDSPQDVAPQRNDAATTRVNVFKLWPRLDEPTSAHPS